MFDLIASAIQAYNQVGMFVGALIFIGIGGLILGNSLYWRVHALRVTGTVLGVLASGNNYTPVYRYTGPDGRSHEAKADNSSSWVGGKETGRVVHLMISPHDPEVACESGSYIFEVIGLACVLPGAWLGYMALTAFPITRMTWIIAAAFLIYAGERLARIWKSFGGKLSLEQWQQHRSDHIDLAEVQHVESLPAAAAPAQMSPANRKFVIPILAFFSMALMGAGLYDANFVYRLQASGTRAEGEIIRFAEKSDSHNGTSFYAIVRFKTADDRTIQFQDQIGSNPPTHREGDKVRVLYLAAAPNRSMVDRGLLFNWGIPALLLVAAAGTALLMLKLLRTRQTGIGPPGRT